MTTQKQDIQERLAATAFQAGLLRDEVDALKLRMKTATDDISHLRRDQADTDSLERDIARLCVRVSELENDTDIARLCVRVSELEDDTDMAVEMLELDGRLLKTHGHQLGKLAREVHFLKRLAAGCAFVFAAGGLFVLLKKKPGASD